ncbi:hypothetical protein RHGRI_010923 [Rhododendron griersonianum]|uniref:Uncharacterized protein n=1 Tax=Rhododendron griersonianum TaxID=479676 RepID=A0AAV6KK20_9ERIC|nr:hypothetical protein RHGRI_010923 [Rhododendron griersonianum]
MHCSRHAKTKGGQGMTHGMPKQGEAKAWQADCFSPGKAMHCSRHAKTSGVQVMASRFLFTGQGMHCSRLSETKGGQGLTPVMPKQGVDKAWQTDCLSPGKGMRCSRHAKTRGGQDDGPHKGWPRHGKLIACHRARQCIAHGMPKQGVAKAWQVDCMSPGKAMHWPRHDSRHAKTRGGQGMASGLLVTGQGKAMHCSRHAKTKGDQVMTHGMPKQGEAKVWQADSLSLGKAMHCSWHAKTKGGQGMASQLRVTGQDNALLTACQDQGWPRHDRHGKPIACHRARQCIAHGMPKQGVAKAWQADCLSPGKAMHCSRHAKTKGGQGMTHGMPK